MARLIDELKKLPGVGSKTAQRFAFHILRSSDEDADLLAAAVHDVKAKLRLCSVCNNITDVDPVRLLQQRHAQSATGVRGGRADQHRGSRKDASTTTASTTCCTERCRRCTALGPDQLRIANLASRIESESVDELILATNPTVEGEATATYLSRLFKSSGVKVTRIATGVPVGSDIEYADEVTMQKAMEGRREL